MRRLVGILMFMGPEHVEWDHGCAALCTNVTFWTPTVTRCPHCGRPAPDSAGRGGGE